MIDSYENKLSPGRLLIDGQWVETAKNFDTSNPATGEVLTQIASASAADVDRAVAAARKAFDDRTGAWRKMSASERGRLIWRLADLLEKNIDEFAELETLDNGKPIFESRYVDMPMVIDVLRYYAGWATKIHGETVNTFETAFTYTLREPVGVVGMIVPWNFPLLLSSWKLGPALACGNTVVWKPASLTPLTALRFGELAVEAGVPAGVINVVTGNSEVGPHHGAHPGIDKIAFTGSTEVGKEIMRGAADTMKRITLELGGKSPNIVFADADIDSAVKGAITGIFYGKGEVCNAGSRLFVESKVQDEFLEKLVARAKKMRLADPLDPKTRMGAIVSQEQMQHGAGLHRGGQEGRREADRRWQSRFGRWQQRLFHRADDFQRRQQQHEDCAGRDIWSGAGGDQLSTTSIRPSRRPIRIPYGLASAVWTRDLKKAHLVSRQLKAGTVWINTYGLMDAAMPFGGYKSPALGRELGEKALEHYTEKKTVWMNLG